MKFSFRLFWLLCGLLAPAIVFAHIGSSTVIYEGTAGPYPVRVIIRPPTVIPGRAEIDLRFINSPPPDARVTVLPVAAGLGLKGSPPPDEALPVRGDNGLRHAELWLMTKGSYSVHVDVSGKDGQGRVIVPVAAIAVRQPTMSTGLEVTLGFLGALLFSSAVSLVVVGARESTLPPGVAPPPGKRRTLIAASIAIVVFGFGLRWGKGWWDQEDRWYRTNQMYRPLPMAAQPRLEAGQRLLRLSLAPDPRDPRAEPPPLLADHGKLMHLFLIREPQLDAFAHVHPIRISARDFDLPVPPLPAGTYRLYGDVTFEDGFASTLTTQVDLPPLPEGIASGAAAGLAADPDDSWFIRPSTPSAASPAWTVKALNATTPRAGEAVSLQFEVDDASGKPVQLDPYMGMLGHAAVRRSDGSVFAHLHPVGTISMASQHYFENQARDPAATAAPMDHHHMHAMSETATTVSFPYEFPVGGKYRLWVQTKTQGQVVTGVFDLDVAEPKK